MIRAGLFAAAVFVFAFAMPGCASSRDARPSGADRAAVAAIDPTALPITTGDAFPPEPVPYGVMLRRLASADAVLFGELHGHPAGLALARRLTEDLIAARPGSFALALEFVERDEQHHLDDYLTGVTDLEGFTAALGRTSPPDHTALIDAARDAGRPVIAANAPRRYVRLARTAGLDRLAGLNAAQRALFRAPAALTEGGYRERFYEVMGAMFEQSSPHARAATGGDGGGEEAGSDAAPAHGGAHTHGALHADDPIRPFFVAQNVWDATMAESVARARGAGLSPVLLIVGQFHTDHAGGLVERLRALRPTDDIVTVSLLTEPPTDDDADRADFLVEVGPPPAHN